MKQTLSIPNNLLILRFCPIDLKIPLIEIEGISVQSPFRTKLFFLSIWKKSPMKVLLLNALNRKTKNLLMR